MTCKVDPSAKMSVIGEDGLVVPRKLRNPCLESTANRDLNRQIKWNAKAGVNVLSKSELEKALDRQRRLQIEREREDLREDEETPFDKALKERAKKLEQIESDVSPVQSKDDNCKQPVAKRTNIFEQAALTSKSEHNLSKSQPSLKSPHNISVTSASRHNMSVTSSNPANSCHIKINKDLESRLKNNNKIVQNPLGQGYKSGAGSRPGINICGGHTSSGNSSKSSSPEPELFKVFAQLRTKDEDDYM